jgi:hypothetical protein
LNSIPAAETLNRMGNLITKILSIASNFVHLGGLLNGSKTIIGIISTAAAAVQYFAPEYSPIVLQVLTALGVPLLPIGAADKLRKAREASPVPPARRVAFPVE